MSNGYKHHHHHRHRHRHHHNHNQNFHHPTTTFLPLLCRSVSAQDIKLQQQHVLPKLSGDPTSPRVSCIGHVKRSNKVTGFPTPPSKFTSTTTIPATPGSRRPIPNSSYSHYRPAPTHKPRFHTSKCTSPPPLTTITATATIPGVCGSARGAILNSNYSSLRTGVIHKTISNKPKPISRTPISTADAADAATTAATPGVRGPIRGLILNSSFSAAAAAAGKSNLKYTKLKGLFSGKNLTEPTKGSNCRTREMKMVNCRRRREGDLSLRNYDVELDRPLPVVKKVKEPGFDREEVNLWKRRSTTNGFELKSLQIQQIHVGNYNHHHTPTTV